ncbi:glycosyltransferase [Sphingomonas sp. MMS24-J13]|uniref:glycosyltransferase n=1 Tax=Sphingomonas sp. MMS24-J13 TaxID=3238686 RepID=UPI00384CBD2A
MSLTELVMIDPDAIDHFGHYLAYDSRLALAATRQGLSFSVLGHAACDPFDLDLSFRLQPALSRHSWAIGKCPMGAAVADLTGFEAELSEQLRRRDAVDGREFRWFLYVGSLEHAQCISNVLDGFDRHRFLVNLFYTPFFDFTSDDYYAGWRGFVANHHPHLRMSAPSEQFAARFAARFGVQLPVTPHPSTTFGDQELPPPVPVGTPTHAPLRILFPGGMREEKGFALTADVAIRLQTGTSQSYACAVRALARPSTPPGLLGSIADLQRAGVEVVGGMLDDAAFRALLADADLIVLPYGGEFRERTSGLLIDALLLSTPVVVIAGTWLADLVTRHGVGRVAEESVEGIIAAIHAAAADHAALRANIGAFREGYLAGNSWADLVRFITD